MRGLTRDTLVEMVNRKLIYVLAAITLMAVLGVILSLTFEFEIHIDGDFQDMFGDVVKKSMYGYLNFFMWLLSFIIVMTTAGILPSMFQKGTADFYLSKPISRSYLLLYKIFSIWGVYGGFMFLSGCLITLTIILCYNVVDFGILYILFGWLIIILVWLSITTFVGVFSGSTGFAIMATFIVWLIQKGLASRDFIVALVDSKPLETTLDVIYYIFPKFTEMSNIVSDLAFGVTTRNFLPIWSSVAFAVVLIYGSVLVFSKKDY